MMAPALKITRLCVRQQRRCVALKSIYTGVHGMLGI